MPARRGLKAEKSHWTVRAYLVTHRLIPNKKGTDLFDADKTINAHVRLEQVKGDAAPMIYVTIFDNTIKDADEAFQDAQAFLNDEGGAREATEYLRDNGIKRVTIQPAKV